MLNYLANIFGKPGSPSSPSESKKPRRSQRISRGDDLPEASGPSTPARAIIEAKHLATPEIATPEIATPEIVTREVERTPASSPGPVEATQVASQFYCPPLPEEDEDTEPDPNVWGCLVPLNSTDPARKIIKLNKNPDTPVARRGGNTKKSPSGFLVGRHPECDLHISSPVISNRHCVIYKEITKNKPRAVLEDLSANGTWVNGLVVGRNNRRELQSGDEIEFAGGVQYVFRYPKGMIASKFHETYEQGRPLGSGHFATVFTAIEKATGNAYAVKVFKKRRSDDASKASGLQQEIAMLMSVSHPNVLCLKGTYDEDDGVYLVLELAPEGELFNYIIAHQKLSEDETRKIFKQLLNGLKYLHDRNIVHRDIKPENILLIDKNLTVKLADFGLAKIIGEDSFTTSLCGTPSYVAPEILQSSSKRAYDRAVDVWSLGVVLYICLCGFPPFSDELYSREKPYNLSEQIKRGLYDFPSPYWDSVGDPALDLIERMLDVDPKRRISVAKALEHPWITERPFDPHGMSVNSFSSLTDAIGNLGFVRRQVQQERTLLAEAPGLANSSLPNPSRAQVRIHHNNGGQASATNSPSPARGRAEVREAESVTPTGKGKAPANAVAPGPGGKRSTLDPSTKAFVNIGGKAGDETLYGDSFDSTAAQVESD